MLPPKLRHVLGSLAFSEKNFIKQCTLRRSNHFLKIQWKIHFWLFEILTKTLRNFFFIEIWTFSLQICFQNQFWTAGSGQTEYTQIRAFAYFQFDHFSKLKIDSESRFEMRLSIFLLYFFFEEVRSIFQKVNKWISHCIFEKWFDRRRQTVIPG